MARAGLRSSPYFSRISLRKGPFFYDLGFDTRFFDCLFGIIQELVAFITRWFKTDDLNVYHGPPPLIFDIANLDLRARSLMLGSAIDEIGSWFQVSGFSIGVLKEAAHDTH